MFPNLNHNEIPGLSRIKLNFRDFLGPWNTHTHPFNGPFSGTTQVSWYQKGGTNLDFTEARDSEWQWHQLGQMQVCTLLQTDNHTSTHHSVFYRPDALPAAHTEVTYPVMGYTGIWVSRHFCLSAKLGLVNWDYANCNINSIKTRQYGNFNK